jgi:glycolate oxidase iron-sulfur subunit
MRTEFRPEQLTDPRMAHSESILRKCVHCGFCTATCPTYVLLGDELDSPRGRIALIKNMLEKGDRPTEKVVKHLDRCLSCLSCMTTCPSGVNYMHLIDHGRAHVERHYRRPWRDRLLRGVLARVMPYPGRFRAALRLARLAGPIARLFRGRWAAMLALARTQAVSAAKLSSRAHDAPRKRVALLGGCVQNVLGAHIHQATIRLLHRQGCAVSVVPGAGCCGALSHHLGKDARSFARANIDAWLRERDAHGLDAIVVDASGCGTMLKDYGFLFRDDPAYAQRAQEVAAMTRDVTELVAELGFAGSAEVHSLRVAYHSACSLQHGQAVRRQPTQLLTAAGFEVVEPPEAHLCCGSAGVYNITQPEIAENLRQRKVRNIESVAPEIIATGNIGCMIQLAQGTSIPIVHTAELLDWATGGPKPTAMRAAVAEADLHG